MGHVINALLPGYFFALSVQQNLNGNIKGIREMMTPTSCKAIEEISEFLRNLPNDLPVQEAWETLLDYINEMEMWAIAVESGDI
jgi:hypothetical protein